MQIMIAGCFLLAALFSTPCFSRPARAADVPDSSLVEGAETYRKAVLSGDAAAVAAMYREDAVILTAGQPPVQGRAAIEEYYARFLRGPVKITGFWFTHLDCTAVGDTGYDVGTYKQTLSGGPAGTIEDTGKYIAILKRTDGVWKLAYLMHNSDHPVMSPGAGSTH